MLWLFTAIMAVAHPGADGHAAHDCDDVPAVLRYAQALTTDGRFVDANAAIAVAVACGADPAETDLASATVLLAAGEPAKALPFLERAAKVQPGPATLVARAEALDALGRHAEAADDRLRVLDLVDGAAPDVYLAAARSLGAAGRTAEALAIIDRGLAAVGPVAGLVRAGVEMAEVADPDDALRRLDVAPPSSAWLQLRGEVLARAGRVDEAREVLERALEAARTGRRSRQTSARIAALQATLTDLEAR